MKQVSHYAGKISHRNGFILAGFAACCCGDKAWKIRYNKQHTYYGQEVTCKLCIKKMILHNEYTAAQGANCGFEIMMPPNAPTSPGRAQDDGQAPETIVAAPVQGLVGRMDGQLDTTKQEKKP